MLPAKDLTEKYSNYVNIPPSRTVTKIILLTFVGFLLKNFSPLTRPANH